MIACHEGISGRESATFSGLSVYGLRLRFDGGGHGGGFAGSAWRGFMGRALHRAVCHAPVPACHGCPKTAMCAYPTLFKPLDEQQLPPFWLHGWQRRRRGWSVGIRWLGATHGFAIGEWLDALSRQPGELGGRPVTLQSADSDTGRRLWCAAQGWRALPTPLPLATASPAPRHCSVEFLTPLVSKHRGDPLFGALRTRLQRLIQRYGDGRELPRTERPWNARVLARKPQRIPLARRTLSGTLLTLALDDLTPEAWSLLVAGAELHAGGQTVLGCGHYRIETA